MKLFQCEHCGQTLFFEDGACSRCHNALGCIRELDRLAVLPDAPGDPGQPFQIAGARAGTSNAATIRNTRRATGWCGARRSGPRATRYRIAVITVPFVSGSCALTEVIPDLSDPDNLGAWVAIERAKRRLLNGLSRSMGLEDACPLVLSGPVRAKLRFIHQVIVQRPAAKSTRRPVRLPPAEAEPCPHLGRELRGSSAAAALGLSPGPGLRGPQGALR